MLTLPKVNIPKSQIDWEGLPKRFFNEGELETLITLVKSVNPKTVVEFGINTGRTAKSIMREVDSVEQYIGVDVPVGYVTEKTVQRGEIPEQAGELVIGDKRLKLIVRDNGSHDMTEDDLPEIDVAFIDGDHSRRGVEQDTKLARAKVRKGGLIIWHDYHDMGCVDVRDVLHDFVKDGYDIKHVDGTWLAYEVVK